MPNKSKRKRGRPKLPAGRKKRPLSAHLRTGIPEIRFMNWVVDNHMWENVFGTTEALREILERFLPDRLKFVYLQIRDKFNAEQDEKRAK